MVKRTQNFGNDLGHQVESGCKQMTLDNGWPPLIIEKRLGKKRSSWWLSSVKWSCLS